MMSSPTQDKTSVPGSDNVDPQTPPTSQTKAAVHHSGITNARAPIYRGDRVLAERPSVETNASTSASTSVGTNDQANDQANIEPITQAKETERTANKQPEENVCPHNDKGLEGKELDEGAKESTENLRKKGTQMSVVSGLFH